MTLNVYVDWDKNGFGTGALDDVSADIRGRIEAAYGRDQVTALAPTMSGEGSMALSNTSRRYSPGNTSSPLTGKIKPARPVLITRTVDGSVYTLFVAHTSRSPINPDVSAQNVSISLVDSLADFRGPTVSTALYSGIRTGAAIGAILDAVGWTGGRDLDAGASVLPYWWEEGTDTLTALQNLVAAEGPPALLTIGPSGEVVFRDRHHRLVRAASKTAVGTWSATGPEPIPNLPFQYDAGWQNVINYADLEVTTRRPGVPGTVVWSSDDVITVGPGETVPIKAVTSDPFLRAVTPVVGTDLLITAGSTTPTVTLSRTSGASTTIFVRSTGTTRITSIQLRATPVPVIRTQSVTVSDNSSILDYGVCAHPDIPFASFNDVRAIVATTLAMRAQPLPTLTVTFQVGGATVALRARAQQILARNLSDRLTVIEPVTGINADFFIERIAHSVAGDEDHLISFGMEAAPTQVANVFILGSATRGILGTNRLGKQGLDDPATVFVLGSGVLGTNLLGH